MKYLPPFGEGNLATGKIRCHSSTHQISTSTFSVPVHIKEDNEEVRKKSGKLGTIFSLKDENNRNEECHLKGTLLPSPIINNKS